MGRQHNKGSELLQVFVNPTYSKAIKNMKTPPAQDSFYVAMLIKQECEAMCSKVRSRALGYFHWWQHQRKKKKDRCVPSSPQTCSLNVSLLWIIQALLYNLHHFPRSKCLPEPTQLLPWAGRARLWLLLVGLPTVLLASFFRCCKNILFKVSLSLHPMILLIGTAYCVSQVYLILLIQYILFPLTKHNWRVFSSTYNQIIM